MSIQNFNTNIVPCIPIGENDTGKIHLKDIHTDTFEIVTDGKSRKLSKLYFVLFFNPIENTEVDKEPSEVFSFDENYAIRIRLTETANHSSHDLDEFQTKESFDKIVSSFEGFKTCRFMRICFFEDIPFPPVQDGQEFLIEVLIRKLSKSETSSEENEWMLQSVYKLALTQRESDKEHLH